MANQPAHDTLRVLNFNILYGVDVAISTNEVNYLNPWVFNLFDVQPIRRGILTLNYQIR